MLPSKYEKSEVRVKGARGKRVESKLVSGREPEVAKKSDESKAIVRGN